MKIPLETLRGIFLSKQLTKTHSNVLHEAKLLYNIKAAQFRNISGLDIANAKLLKLSD